MKFTLDITGTSPLLMHNPRMVDSCFEINRQIKAITSKRKKTTEDIKAIEKLEWYGGLFEENGRVVQPTAKIRKCLINTGRISKMGRFVERAVVFIERTVELVYDGPQDINKLFQMPQFHSRLSVGVGKKRVMRVRPQFFPWAFRCEGLFVEDAGLNFDELVNIAVLAGVAEGIGDNRVNGYGRFTAKLEAK
jgi:hypothetical protein